MGRNRQGVENPLTDWLARSQYINELLDVRDGVISIPGQDIGRVLTTTNEICCNLFSLCFISNYFLNLMLYHCQYKVMMNNKKCVILYLFQFELFMSYVRINIIYIIQLYEKHFLPLCTLIATGRFLYVNICGMRIRLLRCLYRTQGSVFTLIWIFCIQRKTGRIINVVIWWGLLFINQGYVCALCAFNWDSC